MDEHVRGWVARLSRVSKKCHWFYVFVFFSGILVTVLGVKILYSQVLFCWLGKGGQLGSWDFRSADFVDDVVMSTLPPSTPSGFLFIIRTSTWQKLQVGLPGCHFLDVSSFFIFTEYVKHFRRMMTWILLCEPVNYHLRHNQDGQRRSFERFTAHWHSTFVNLWGCAQRDQPVSLRQRESSLTGVISILLVH